MSVDIERIISKGYTVDDLYATPAPFTAKPIEVPKGVIFLSGDENKKTESEKQKLDTKKIAIVVVVALIIVFILKS